MKKFKISEEDAAILMVLTAFALICFALTVWGIICVINGDLFAVAWTALTALGGCMLSEEVQRLYENARERSNQE